MEVTLLRAGSCVHPAGVVLPGRGWRALTFPAAVGVIRHPRQGVVLFDTGYSPRFHDATRRLPYRIYALITPVSIGPEETVAARLGGMGLAPEDVALVVVSHFHADHVGAARDFPRARFVCAEKAWTAVRGLSGLRALRAGFLPSLLPEDFEHRLDFLEACPLVRLPADLAPFEQAWDVLGDGSLLAVPLPGHAPGHVGLYLPSVGQGLFLVADAAWRFESIAGPAWPHPLASLVLHDVRAYRETLARLHQLHRANPHLRMVPSHCERSLARQADPGALTGAAPRGEEP